MERPDYVPRTWTRGPVNRWFISKPQRVVAWYAAVVIIALGLAVAALLSGALFVRAFAVAMVGAVIQAVIYGPRAWRARRSSKP
jgi:hypothetical protein